ncbi:nucleotidyltransferase family protein [Kiloniella litopenaei]|uniref:nucleotidyltransferase family protein n=1 Tax=Kiloniella litopenaei TaxID=1549748 RepID=UPI003BA9F954
MNSSPTSDYKELCISPDQSIRSAIEVIDKGGCKTAFIVDKNYKLLGLVADPDIRTAILDKQDFDAPVSTIMNEAPLYLTDKTQRSEAIRFVQHHKRDAIPFLDNQGKVVNMITLAAVLTPPNIQNEIVLMAGGYGKRLLPLTRTKPKPMVKVGTKPILEVLISSLIAQGFKNFTISINYLGYVIKKFFGNGEKWGVNIRYIEENHPLGTAGSLSLLEPKNDLPIVIMNCDVLTKVDFQSLLQHHTEKGCKATLCVSQQEVQIPYGIVEHTDMILDDIVEKPVWNYLINAGVYVFSPEILKLLNHNEPIDMPLFLENIKEKFGDISIFPIREYWLDIGTPSSLQQAQEEYPTHFE